MCCKYFLILFKYTVFYIFMFYILLYILCDNTVVLYSIRILFLYCTKYLQIYFILYFLYLYFTYVNYVHFILYSVLYYYYYTVHISLLFHHTRCSAMLRALHHPAQSSVLPRTINICSVCIFVITLV